MLMALSSKNTNIHKVRFKIMHDEYEIWVQKTAIWRWGQQGNCHVYEAEYRMWLSLINEAWWGVNERREATKDDGKSQARIWKFWTELISKQFDFGIRFSKCGVRRLYRAESGTWSNIPWIPASIWQGVVSICPADSLAWESCTDAETGAWMWGPGDRPCFIMALYQPQIPLNLSHFVYISVLYARWSL